ncbi:MAG TPA: putative Ig domain-containing protein, partial [Lachnospiraceae bacterium]|nr:putative Ig domain-containing protein [Lachnospiraceae bacterium]
MTFDMGYNSVTAGQYPALTYLMYFNVVGDGTLVDFDSINVNAAATLSAPVFNHVSDTVMNIAITSGEEYVFDFSASDSSVIHNQTLSYELQGDAIQGATLDSKTGHFSWNPEKSQSGNYVSYVVASDGVTDSIVKVTITVGSDRMNTVNSILSLYNREKAYVSITVDDYQAAYDHVLEIINQATKEEFYTALDLLIRSLLGLKELNPLLKDGSLNFPEMIADTSLATGKADSLVDNNPVTFTGDLSMKYFILYFGAFYKVKASKFAVQPRNIWPARLAGCIIMGSNDGENWTTLTEESPYSDNLEVLTVKKEYQDTAYRYFKATTLWPDSKNKFSSRESILSMGEFRIYGNRLELETKIREVSISTDAVGINNHEGNMNYPQVFAKRAMAGNTITLDIVARQPLEELTATIAGIKADVEKVDELKYKASVTLTEEAAFANASESARFAISYKYLDAKSNTLTEGEDVTKTTDGSNVFVSSDQESINPLNFDVVYYSSWNNDGVERRTQADIK